MPKKGELCCICRTKSSRRFTASSSFESEALQKCFGLEESRYGKLCEGCRQAVCRFKRNPHLLYSNLVDSKGQLYLTNKHKQINVGKALANWNYQRQRPTLGSLPNEVLLKILSLLSVKDLINIQGISQRFFHFCIDFDDDLWPPIVKQNLGHLYNRMVDIATPFSFWKAVYFLLNSRFYTEDELNRRRA